MAMGPCLHQGNIYTKRKLRVWRDKKYVPLVGAIVNWDGPMAMVPCLHQGNIYINRNLRVWRHKNVFG